MKTAPIQLNERIVTLDVLRGFAILGIFLVNMSSFSQPELLMSIFSIQPELSLLEQWIRLFFDMFVQGKFMTIFSFLFGLGFFMFMTRAEERGKSPSKIMSRRLFILLLFGAAHLFLLWYGDILHTYALAGFILLLFYRRKTKTIIIWACIFFFLFFTLIASYFLIPEGVLSQEIENNQELGKMEVGKAVQTYQNASMMELIEYRLAHEVPIVLINLPVPMLLVLGMFLLGMYAGKKGYFQDVSKYHAKIKNISVISLLLSVPTIVSIYLISRGWWTLGVYNETARYLFIYISGVTLSIFYISLITLLIQHKKWQSLFRPVGYVGRMALTNYILQTVLALTIIYSFNLYGELSLSLGLLISLVIYSLQVVVSYYWFGVYRFGPLEWLWRSLTYGYKQPMKWREKRDEA